MTFCVRSWTPSQLLGSRSSAQYPKPITAETQRRRGKRRENQRRETEMRPIGKSDGSERSDSPHHRGCDRGASRFGAGTVGIVLPGGSLLRTGPVWPCVSAPGSDTAKLQGRSVELRLPSG